MGLKLFSNWCLASIGVTVEIFYSDSYTVSTSKLEEINFPFHPLHCKPSLANILYGQIPASEWRHSKANLGPDENTLDRREKELSCSCFVCGMTCSVSIRWFPLAFSQLNPPRYIWICMNRTDLCIVEHPSGSGFVFIPGPTWHWMMWAKSQWVGFVLHNCKLEFLFKILKYF